MRHLVLPIHLRGRLRRHLVLGASSADNFSKRTSLSTPSKKRAFFARGKTLRMLLKTMVLWYVVVQYHIYVCIYIYISNYTCTYIYIYTPYTIMYVYTPPHRPGINIKTSTFRCFSFGFFSFWKLLKAWPFPPSSPEGWVYDLQDCGSPSFPPSTFELWPVDAQKLKEKLKNLSWPT